MENFHCKSIEQTLRELRSRSSGLKSSELVGRERADVIMQGKKNSIISKFFVQFFDLMIIILLFASAVSIVIGIIEKSSSEIIDGCINYTTIRPHFYKNYELAKEQADHFECNYL